MKEDDGTFGEYRWASASPLCPSAPHTLWRIGLSQQRALPDSSYFLTYKFRRTSMSKCWHVSQD
jgi:hypothetical protein